MRELVLAVAVFAAAACSSSAEPDARQAAERYFAEHADQARPIDSVEVWSDEALVRTGDTRMYLHRFDDGWRVTAAGCRGVPAECEMGGR